MSMTAHELLEQREEIARLRADLAEARDELAATKARLSQAREVLKEIESSWLDGSSAGVRFRQRLAREALSALDAPAGDAGGKEGV